MAAHPNRPARTYHILGIPLRTGSLAPGNEDDARAYRDARLLERLRDAGCAAVDDGDLPIPSYLPHHSIPPIRSWPGPRIVWDLVSEHLAPCLERPGHVPLLIGCDCSIVIGTAQALSAATAPDDVHILYVDGGFDDAPPDPTRSQSAAALAVWLLTHESPFWAGPPLQASQVTVIGATESSRSDVEVRSLPLDDVRRAGPEAAARRALQAIPPSAALLLHLDVDVIRQQEMPAAYFPHPEGLTLAETRALVGTLLADPRLRLAEISEYASLRDLDRRAVNGIIDLLVAGLGT
jgi:arginase